MNFFCERLLALLCQGIVERCLDVEITESAMMQNKNVTVSVLQRLKGIGITVSLDDFGTGYSSLSYLKRLSIDVLKMDRSFVSGLDSTGPDKAIAKAIINLAHELELEVIAEGVEREPQLRLLKAQGCDLVQGYLIDRPMPADEFARRWLSRAS